jgi:hypothetical protein
MRLVLHTTALNGGDEVYDLIDRLVDRVADEVHRVEVPDADLLHESGWYQSARQTRRKVLTTAVAVPPRKHTTTQGPHAKQIEIRNVDEARVADKLAHAPFSILVEDREADGVFLNILVEELGSTELRALWTRGQAVTPRAIEIDTAGGIGAMPQRIDRAISDADTEGRPVRLFVFCDSDKRWPGDTFPHRQEELLRQTCADLSIPLHVLHKRNIENYIPDSVFEATRDDPRNTGNVDRFEALLRRSPVQRDHLPIKDGLKDVERIEGLGVGHYQDADIPDLIILKERLFPKRPRLLVRLNDERRTEFTGPGLRVRDGNNEVDTLLDTIAREL